MHYNNTRTWTVIGSGCTFTFPPICGNFLLITRNFYHYGAFFITCGQYLPSLPFPTIYLHFLHLWPFPTICGHFLPFVGISYHLLAFLTIYLHFLHLWPFPTIYYGGWFVPFRIIVFSVWKGEKAPHENPPNGDFLCFWLLFVVLCLAGRKVAMRKPAKITIWGVFAWRPFATFDMAQISHHNLLAFSTICGLFLPSVGIRSLMSLKTNIVTST